MKDSLSFEEKVHRAYRAGKVYFEQEKMRAKLIDMRNAYIAYLRLEKTGLKSVRPYTMKQIQAQQTKVNNLRRALHLPYIKTVQDLRSLRKEMNE